MTGTTDDARTQLENAIERTFGIDYSSQGLPSSDKPPRISAVLVLFGELDAVDSETHSSSVSDGLDVLLTRRAAHMRHHPGQIAFPGGGAEPGEDSIATALREAEEETGLDPTGVDVLGTLSPTFMQVSNNLVTPVIGWWRRESPVRADQSESHEVMRVPVADLLNPAARGVSVLKHEGMTFRGAAFELPSRFGGDIVWGFTGMLLSSILDGVGWNEPWSRDREFPINPRR